MTQRHPISLRLSASFEEFLHEIGPNQSALIRALALLGADAAGYDLTIAQRDLHAALKDELPAPVADALLAVVARVQHGGTARRAISPRAPRKERNLAALPTDDGANPAAVEGEAAGEHDPFATVGFSFD